MCCGRGAIVHGAIGLAKAALGVGAADEATIEARRAICRACDRAIRCEQKPSLFCRCRECGCVLRAKTRLADESCPLGKWAICSSSARAEATA